MDLGIECNTNLAAGYRMHSREDKNQKKPKEFQLVVINTPLTLDRRNENINITKNNRGKSDAMVLGGGGVSVNLDFKNTILDCKSIC